MPGLIVALLAAADIKKMNRLFFTGDPEFRAELCVAGIWSQTRRKCNKVTVYSHSYFLLSHLTDSITSDLLPG